MTTVGVAGGGLAGSLLAWRAARAHADVTVIDAGPATRCATAAAGMLSPAAERATAPAAVAQLGAASLPLWARWLAELGIPTALRRTGTLLVAHAGGAPELDRLAGHIRARAGAAAAVALDRHALAELEPELAHLQRACLLPDEAHLDADQVMATLRATLGTMTNVAWHADASVDGVGPGELRSGDRRQRCDWACDCRGLGATAAGLRPVRGEIIHLDAPAVTISRPVRLAHPRFPVYIVPRGAGRYLVGATEVESADPGALTVRSALELLGAAYRVHPGFAEARLAATRVGLRPAHADNTPRLTTAPGHLAITGLYRHGFLAGPALVAQATAHMGLAA